MTWAANRGPITRAKLVTEVCKVLRTFIQVSETFLLPTRFSHQQCNQKGKQATSVEQGHERWIVGPGNITEDNLVLFSIEKVSRSSWQPIVYVV
jgi:hypothetical protein